METVFTSINIGINNGIDSECVTFEIENECNEVQDWMFRFRSFEMGEMRETWLWRIIQTSFNCHVLASDVRVSL